MEFFDTINRAAIMVIPKQPFYDWLNSIEPGTGNDEMANKEKDHTIYLITDFEDPSLLDTHIKEMFRTIFKNELAAWYTDKSLWPKNLNWDTFTAWFEIRISTVIYDTVDEEIEKD
jgi:hypothetical protein